MTTGIVDYSSYPLMRQFLESQEVEEIQAKIQNLEHQQGLINEYLKVKYNEKMPPYPKNEDTDYFTDLRSKYTQEAHNLYKILYRKEKEIKLQILREEMEMFAIKFKTA